MFRTVYPAFRMMIKTKVFDSAFIFQFTFLGTTRLL